MTQLHGVRSFVLKEEHGPLSQVSQHSVKLFALRKDRRNTRIDDGKEFRGSIRFLLLILVTYQMSLLVQNSRVSKLFSKQVSVRVPQTRFDQKQYARGLDQPAARRPRAAFEESICYPQ
jgi:hypothetical protein